MSHRTKDLPPLSRLNHSIRELRYHEISRQLLAVVLILLYALTAMPSPLLVAVGMPLAFAGTLIRLYASGFIVKNEELATNGPYALVRHPLYTGNILIVGGFSAANASLWALPLAVIFFWFYYPCAIEYEDRKLKRYFGERWEHWAGNVARARARVSQRRGNAQRPLVVRQKPAAQWGDRDRRVHSRLHGSDRLVAGVMDLCLPGRPAER